MNRVYLSGMFSQKELIKQRSEELVELGVEVTSTWVGEAAAPASQVSEFPDHYLRHTAIIDIHDMLNADKLVLFTPTDEELETVARRSLSRGGRNFEAGFFYALVMFAQYLPLQVPFKREVIVCGQREGIFHWLFDMAEGADSVRGVLLPSIRHFNTWDEVKLYLSGGKQVEASQKTKTANVA